MSRSRAARPERRRRDNHVYGSARAVDRDPATCRRYRRARLHDRPLPRRSARWTPRAASRCPPVGRRHVRLANLPGVPTARGGRRGRDRRAFDASVLQRLLLTTIAVTIGEGKPRFRTSDRREVDIFFVAHGQRECRAPAVVRFAAMRDRGARSPAPIHAMSSDTSRIASVSPRMPERRGVAGSGGELAGLVTRCRLVCVMASIPGTEAL